MGTLRDGETASWIREQAAESPELKRAFIVMAALAAVLVTMWVGLVVIDYADPPEEVDAEDQRVLVPRSRSDGERSAWSYAFAGVGLAAFIGLLGLGGYAVYRLFAQRGPKFSELAAEEQERRKQAGELLKHINDDP